MLPAKFHKAAIRSLQIRFQVAQLPPDFSASEPGFSVFRSIVQAHQKLRVVALRCRDPFVYG